MHDLYSANRFVISVHKFDALFAHVTKCKIFSAQVKNRTEQLSCMT